ncbi:MAG: beta-lactamase class [Patescibacteria group bacterium]|nr:beta-lactamase class [Patescibacteria group bacterium]
MKREHIFIALLTISAIANIWLVSTSPKKEEPSPVDTTNQFPLLSKRIFIENPNDVILNFIPLRQAMREYVSAQNGKVGVYFEYLPSGVSIGVNEKEEVPIASLSKVPIAMSIMKKIEQGKIKLETPLTIEKKHLDKKFGTLWKKGEGTVLSVEEFIRYSLVESDNTANDILFDQLTTNEINAVYENFDIDVNTKDEVQKISPKSYSSIFRSLFLSSYLLEEHSSYILNTLTRTNFNDKIPAGIPPSVPVAHKIGVFQRLDNKQNVSTDCGIVYVPKRQYILCVFVETSDEEEATTHIKYLSNMIYQYITIVQKENATTTK